MNIAVASAMVQAAHRVEARLEEALAGVGLSIAKFETLSILVSQDRPISLSELAAKLVCVRSNVTQLVDRLETGPRWSTLCSKMLLTSWPQLIPKS
jgi:predicted transcriptional regulator